MCQSYLDSEFDNIDNTWLWRNNLDAASAELYKGRHVAPMSDYFPGLFKRTKVALEFDQWSRAAIDTLAEERAATDAAAKKEVFSDNSPDRPAPKPRRVKSPVETDMDVGADLLGSAKRKIRRVTMGAKAEARPDSPPARSPSASAPASARRGQSSAPARVAPNAKEPSQTRHASASPSAPASAPRPRPTASARDALEGKGPPPTSRASASPSAPASTGRARRSGDSVRAAFEAEAPLPTSRASASPSAPASTGRDRRTGDSVRAALEAKAPPPTSRASTSPSAPAAVRRRRPRNSDRAARKSKEPSPRRSRSASPSASAAVQRGRSRHSIRAPLDATSPPPKRRASASPPSAIRADQRGNRDPGASERASVGDKDVTPGRFRRSASIAARSPPIRSADGLLSLSPVRPAAPASPEARRKRPLPKSTQDTSPQGEGASGRRASPAGRFEAVGPGPDSEDDGSGCESPDYNDVIAGAHPR